MGETLIAMGHIPIPRSITVTRGMKHYYYLDLGHVLILCLGEGVKELAACRNPQSE